MLADVPALPALVARHFLPASSDLERRSRLLVRRTTRHALIVHVDAIARADDWPSPLRQAIASARHAQARQALRLAMTLADLHDASQAAGIRLLALKGVALATVLHGDLAARQANDLDVLVEPSSLGTMAALLGGLGFAPDAMWRDWTTAHYDRLARTHHEFGFHHRDGLTVEVHTRLTTAFIPKVPAFDELWCRRQMVSVAGREVATPGLSDTLVHLSTHGYRHAWARVGWICDIAHLMARADLDWDEVARRARQQREWVAMGGALALAHDLLGARMPPSVVPGRRARDAARCVAARVRAGAIDPNGRDMLGDHWRSRDTAVERARYLWRVATTMTPADCGPDDRWPPSAFTRLVRRPLRLVRRYAPGRSDGVPSAGR